MNQDKNLLSNILCCSFHHDVVCLCCPTISCFDPSRFFCVFTIFNSYITTIYTLPNQHLVNNCWWLVTSMSHTPNTNKIFSLHDGSRFKMNEGMFLRKEGVLRNRAPFSFLDWCTCDKKKQFVKTVVQ